MMPATQPFETIVFVDIPDPDNILMILYVLAVSKGRVAIVLSPRIVDLSVVRYGEKFSEMRTKLGFKIMLDPIKQDNPPQVPEKWEKFFKPDATLSDPKVKKDTRLYVHVSKLRIKECIQEQFPKRKDYEIFWDPNSLSKIKEPDMRHALHAADYAFNFDDNERKVYEGIISNHTQSGLKQRKALRAIIKQYIARKTEEMGLNSSKPKPTDINDLFKANDKIKNARLIIGGPLTEALQYIENTKGRPKIVYAMLGTLTNDRNIMGRPQFNVGKDAESANAFLKKIVDERIRMLVVPTECCKGKDEEDPCPYVLERCQYKELLEKSPLMFRMVPWWGEETGQETHYHAFDWITATVVTRQDIFKWVPVKHKACLSGKSVTNIKFAKSTQPSTIFMAKPDYRYMDRKKPVLWEELKRTFQRDGGLRIGK